MRLGRESLVLSSFLPYKSQMDEEDHFQQVNHRMNEMRVEKRCASERIKERRPFFELQSAPLSDSC
jgi:hypothetical protein